LALAGQSGEAAERVILGPSGEKEIAGQPAVQPSESAKTAKGKSTTSVPKESDQDEEEQEEEDEDEEEDEPLETDRPDFTEASSVVGAGRIQWEMGYTYVHNDDDGILTRTHSAPEVLCRIGLTENLELRLAWNYLVEREDDFGVISEIDGAEDLEVGVKIALTEQHHWFPETALILAITTPTGRNEFSNEEVTFGMSLLYGWDLPCDFNCGGSTIYGNPSEHTTLALASLPDAELFDRHNLFAQSFTIGVPVLSDWWRMYLEYFGIFTEGLSSDVPQNYFNGGFTWLLTNDLQLDWRAGVGLNHAADDFFTGAGAAWRY
jgi:hypothetical protein